MTGSQIKVLIGLVVVIWAVTLLVQGHPVPLDYIKAFSYAVTGVSFALVLWNKWLWSWRVFRPWLTTRPDLRGTWKGNLVSNWVDPITRQGRGEIEAYLVIRQTFSTVDARLHTSESFSVSLSADIVADGEGVHTLAVVYQNTPRALLRERSPIGHGGMLLYVRGVPVHQLDGEYWTDRGTKGELTLTLRSKDHMHDFAQAQNANYKTSK
jgi:predicted pore-forming effector associated with SMODS systems